MNSNISIDTKSEFEKLYTLFLEVCKAESDLRKVGIYMDESVFISSIYGIFDIAITYLLNEEGLEIFYNDIIFQDIDLGDVLDTLEDYFL